MEKSLEPKSGPKTEKAENKPTSSINDQRKVFIGSAISMSWQLAIVVLVPIIGGFKLDQHLNSSPLWTIVGFVIAMLGTFAIMYRALHEFSGNLGSKK